MRAVIVTFALMQAVQPMAAFAQTRDVRFPSPPPSDARAPGPQQSPIVYYSNCDAARAAGVAPLKRGQPGYRPELDRDGDGIACEPYRGRR
jgi:hypothetical protein